jgi:flagellar basal-body rod protein FlgB
MIGMRCCFACAVALLSQRCLKMWRVDGDGTDRARRWRNFSRIVFMLDRIDSELSVQRTALAVATRRQELIASNIANADTPNFKARDLDFREAFAAAVAGRAEGVTLRTTSARHLPGGSGDADGVAAFAGVTKYRAEFQPSVDGNTVNMDVERGAFAENALRLEAALAFLNGRIKSLQMAMSQ